MIDNELREILGQYAKGVLAITKKGFPSREPYIEQIKQAIGREYLTGQEWYDAFIKEVREKPLETFYSRVSMEYFARRAAGFIDPNKLTPR